MRAVAGRYIYDASQSFDNAVWLIGDGRSGTTWLSGLINHKGDYRYMFEPFHHKVAPRDAGFHDNIYIRPYRHRPVFVNFVKQVFSGLFLDFRVEQFNCPRFVFTRRLIKDVFALMCSECIRRIVPQARIVFLLRHPFSVALSKRRLSAWEWGPEPADLLRQDELREDFLLGHESTIHNCRDDFEKFVLLWAILHKVALTQLDLNAVNIVFYEELLARPKETISELFDGLDIDVDWHLLSGLLNVPSAMAMRNTRAPTNTIDAWKEQLDKKQLAAGLAILDEFAMIDLYSDKTFPSKGAVIQQAQGK